MRGFGTQAPGTFGWAELNARGIDKALPFYTDVFGWSAKESDIGDGQATYNEFQQDGQSVAGAWEMDPNVPAEVPSYWTIYFNVDDVDAAFARAVELGARRWSAPRTSPVAASRSSPTRRAPHSGSSGSSRAPRDRRIEGRGRRAPDDQSAPRSVWPRRSV